MITELSIRNFAIIDDISITFHQGLTVLTGETGAGKSIIIDAVELLTGGRGSVEFVRHGAKKAEISGLFSLDGQESNIVQACHIYGIDTTDNMLILERTITKQGKSICRINGKIVTLTVLRKIGQSIVNIHSQHDNVQLMDSKMHIGLLDVYNHKDITPIKKEYIAQYNELTSLRQKYNKISKSEQETAHRMDLLQFQLNELKQANLVEDEEIKLMQERNQLSNYEKVFRAVNETYYTLYGEQKALELLDVAQLTIQEAKDYDPFIQEKADTLSAIYFDVEEISHTLRDFLESLHFDENRLNDIEARLHEINRLMKKYGSTTKEMIAYQHKIEIELDEMENKDAFLEKLESEIRQKETKAVQIAKKLRQVRLETAKHLEKEIKTELNDLYLEHAVFTVQFKEKSIAQLDANGLDHIVFMIATNKGEPPKEMSKVASGGELSRIMLALKKIFASHDQIITVIFDEIDTGVSGRVAQSIAEKMYQISTTTQVLCITHLPQVAAMSDHHLLIQKREQKERTTTIIKDLVKDEKVQEIGRMMTGATLTDTALEHSEQLLLLTETFKNSVS